MNDTTLLVASYVVLAVAAIAAVAGVAGLVLAVRDLRRPRQVTLSVLPAERDLSRAA